MDIIELFCRIKRTLEPCRAQKHVQEDKKNRRRIELEGRRGEGGTVFSVSRSAGETLNTSLGLTVQHSRAETCGCADRVHLLTVGIRQIPKNKKSLVLSAKIWLEPSSSVEIGDMGSPHWRRGHRLQPISTLYWVGQMGAEGVASTVKTLAFIPFTLLSPVT
jgi:hypothetical protein